MTRPAHNRGSRSGAVVTGQAGFTLVELLVTMLLSIVVIGGGTYAMSTAFRSSSETSSRTAATNQAEVRFEVLTRDLRQAVSCPTGLTFGGSASTSSIGLVITAPASSVTLQVCDPAPGLPVSAAGSQVPQAALVTWTCTYSTKSCTRQTQNISGSNVTGTATTTNTITGVVSLSLNGLVRTFNGFSTYNPTGYANLATLGTANFYAGATAYTFYPENPNPWVTWVGISAQIVSLRTPDSTTNLTPATGTSPVTFQTGVALRNAVG